MARLRVERLSKVFPGKTGKVRAVDGLSLAVEEGELLVVLGPSGCGKTTTLRLMAGLETPDEGSIELDGERIEARQAEGRGISLAFQSPTLFPQLTVERNVELGLRLRKVPGAERQERVAEVLRLLEITELAERLPEQLSGGQQQRVSLARALATSPRLFLLDEPLANLDPGTRGQLREVIQQIQRRTGTAMIYVTHDQGEALALGDRIAVMRNGRIEQIGSAFQVYHSPATLFVAEFIGSPPINVFEGICRDGRVTAPGLGREWEWRGGASDIRKVLVAVRPEDIRLGSGGGIRARVAEITPAFPEMHVRLEGEGFTVRARARFANEWKVGEVVTFDFDSKSAHLFEAESGKRAG